MEKYTMFIDRKNQYSENEYYSKESIDSMQSLSSYQWYFMELEQIISQFVWKYKKP